jgi:uncharacterized membrane protein (UPF0182 family)
LKRVIVALGNKVIMAEDFYKALNSVLEGEITAKETISTQITSTEGISDLGALALQHYNNAKAYLSKGDWAGYGNELEKLEEVLKQLVHEVEGKE